jgi:hypothetical protein
MKIKPFVALSTQQEVISLVCENTGIASAIVIPALPSDIAQTLTWTHPFSYWANVKGLLVQPRSWFEKLDNQSLAGLILSAYKRFELLDTQSLSAVEANKIIATASADTLIDLVYLARFFTEKACSGVGFYTLDWISVKDSPTLDKDLKAFYTRIRPYFIREDKKPATPQDRATLLSIRTREGRQLAGGTYLSGKATLSRLEEEFDQKLKANKKELVMLADSLAGRGLITAKQHGILKALSKARALVTLESTQRDNIIKKLAAIAAEEATAIIKILQDSINPYDWDVRAADELDRASDEFSQVSRPRTIDDILAAKRAAANKSLQDNQEVEAGHDL